MSPAVNMKLAGVNQERLVHYFEKSRSKGQEDMNAKSRQVKVIFTNAKRSNRPDHLIRIKNGAHNISESSVIENSYVINPVKQVTKQAKSEMLTEELRSQSPHVNISQHPLQQVGRKTITKAFKRKGSTYQTSQPASKKPNAVTQKKRSTPKHKKHKDIFTLH